jgi:lysophospholipase L1-like esterase
MPASRARTRRLLIALAVVVVAALAAVVLVVVRPWEGAASDASTGRSAPATGPAGRTTGTPRAGSTYLALGDSVPFGFRANETAAYPQAGNFTGYPELVARDLGLTVLNASCPGETTASFSDTSARAFGCENSPQSATAGYRTVYPLHVRYPLPQSQLDYAVTTLRATPGVGLVTIQLGANDAFLCRDTTGDQCAGEGPSVVATAQHNLEAILSALRTRGRYTGRIVVVTYYALDYTGLAGASTQYLDGALTAAAQAHGAEVASGYDAFQPAAQKAGGNAITAGLILPGDVHPTASGQQLLATAVEDVLRR